MKVKHLIFTILILGIVINSGVIVFFVSLKINEIGKITTQTGSSKLMESTEKNLLDIASGISGFLDKELQSQYLMVKTWAEAPTLLETAKNAQSKTKEELYEMWSAAATRQYDGDEAVGDGDPANDLNPAASAYLSSLSSLSKIYPEIFITDNRGYAIAANLATGDFDQGPDDWRIFQNASGTPYFKMNKPETGGEGWFKAANESADGFWVSDVMFDESSKTWGLEIVSLLKSQESKQNLGQIKAVLDLSELVNDIANIGELDIDSVRIITQEGKIIANYDISGAHKNAQAELMMVSPEFLGEIAKNQKSGMFTEKNADQELTTAYQKSSDQNGYIVAISKNNSKINQPIASFISNLKNNIDEKGDELIESIALIAAIFGLLILVIAFFLINKQIVNPLKRMTEVADKLSDGNFEIEIPVIKTGNEIEKLCALTALLVSVIKHLKKDETIKK